MAARTTSSAHSSSSPAVSSSSAAGTRAVRASSPASSLLAPNSAIPSTSARSRHSLYGAEDRVVLDLGSRVWKIGFSGESTPRAVFDVGEGELWTYEAIDVDQQRAQHRHCQRMIKKLLRRVYYDELMTDPKARKVIVLENPMLPLRMKQIVANVLFEHLQVPSLSFALTPLCALLSIGRATGLVVDVGNLETCSLPIFASRPLYSHIRTSPLASRRLSKHLFELLRRFAVLNFRDQSLQPNRTHASSPRRTRVTPVPDDILSVSIVEEVKTRACYVDPDMLDEGISNPLGGSHSMSRINSDNYSGIESSQAEKEAFLDFQLEALRRKHTSDTSAINSEATNLALRMSTGTLNIPGWLRHACTDIFFEPLGDPDEPSIPELILDSILKLPIDLRKVFISNILLIGGGSMLAGFPLRLSESIRTLLHRDKRYISLRGLSRSICIVNCASKHTGESEAVEEEHAASFAWERSLLAWVGASLVGAMKASGKEEWTKESYEKESVVDGSDWTRRGW